MIEARSEAGAVPPAVTATSVRNYRWEAPPPELELTAQLRNELLRLTEPALATAAIERLTEWLHRSRGPATQPVS
ncbi:hypothetical protein [Micromonospora sp. AMSO31t]|uniref:hypothetical protein n=1 Tax=Micromonospora sp. AMSO31t TaxID=2650566 RepID=UPI00124B23C8|nr:hypothetical protein [Micromonospora sp. AMSO31t]KAB1913923.1 hypothetical protein F8274_08700 [Micromonospora sp. AMSO31t]